MGTAKEGFNRDFYWYQGNGVPIKIKDMEDAHLLHTIVKLERHSTTSSKLGQNNIWFILPFLRDEVKYRKLEHKLVEYRIRDAMKRGDVRRLVLATADKERNNGTPDAEAKGDIP